MYNPGANGRGPAGSLGGMGNQETPALGVVHAAGGIPLRHAAGGSPEIALVHRPARADWSFPKGKVEPGESFEDCARREVREETGLRCRLGSFVGSTEYRDRKDRPKVVLYWLMVPEGGSFRENDEVDDLRWVDLHAARQLLSYDRDRDLLAVLAQEDWPTG
jgi:8-oxo-dGTP diphosphatase